MKVSLLACILIFVALPALAQTPPQTCEQQLADVKQYANVLATSRNNTEAMLAQTAAQVTALQAQVEALEQQVTPKTKEKKP